MGCFKATDPFQAYSFCIFTLLFFKFSTKQRKLQYFDYKRGLVIQFRRESKRCGRSVPCQNKICIYKHIYIYISALYTHINNDRVPC